MFNQKLNHYIYENPAYLNTSSGTPYTSALSIHNCGTTINTYNLEEPCGRLPLQTWCYKDVAVESFGMRSITNSKEYFESINNYLKSVVDNDSGSLIGSALNNESYKLVTDYGVEPLSSFLQMIRLDVTNKLGIVMGNAANEIDIFKNSNPLCEGFIITDIDFTTYKSYSNENHYYHKIVFSVNNTTRYNTISMKAEIYQDTTDVIKNWNTLIREVEDSKDVNKNLAKKQLTKIYFFHLDLLNGIGCVTGVEDECMYSAYSGTTKNPQLINKNMLIKPFDNIWLQQNSLADSTYLDNGDYNVDGIVKITDSGPDNLDNLIKELTTYNNNFREF
jgi:hypothetical protein